MKANKGYQLLAKPFNSGALQPILLTHSHDKGKGSQRGAKPLLRKTLPLPLVKGKGIKGMGLVTNFLD